MPSTEQELQQQFFEFLFGEQEGYLCIATQTPGDKATHKDIFFRWPSQKADIIGFIKEVQTTKHVYFCVHLLDKARRLAENALPTRLVWSDLDAQRPDTIAPHPSVVLQSSPGRFQAFWRMARPVSPDVAQDYSRRIAYALEKADKSGWDLSQILRVPYTLNLKYEEKPLVEIAEIHEDFVAVEDFEGLRFIEVASANGDGASDGPEQPEIGRADVIIERYAIPLGRTDFHELFVYAPTTKDDWSRLLWKLINTCLEAGLSADETFTVCFHSGVNKYERDGRPSRYLWRDVLKAEAAQLAFEHIHTKARTLAMPELYKDSEVTKLPHYWIDDYSDWASAATDALPQYHGLAGVMAMSAVTASSVRLETSYGEFVPNLWAMVLGESTLTRKTTAMTLITNMLAEIDDQMIMATDGSTEGVLTALSFRPKRVSIFYRDEVSGFFNAVTRKDYLAGMIEVFTQLYDSPKILSRVLRKEVIRISNPVFLFFAGGIRDRIYSSLSEEHVISGFVPRFLVVSGETELSKFRPTARPTAANEAGRDRLMEQLRSIYELYNKDVEITIGDVTVTTPAIIRCEMNDAAWSRYGEIETLMATTAYESPMSMLALPVFERLSRSMLKLAMVLAASRRTPKDGVIKIEKQDILKAATLIQDWGRYSIDLAMNCGIANTEKTLQKIKGAIDRSPGIYRGDLMRSYHLSKREADEILLTLEDRGEVRIVKRGKASQLWVV